MNRISLKKCFNTFNKKEPIILMLGAPGVGKGTYSRMLSKNLNIPEFSTGEEIRKLIKSDPKDPELLKIKQIVQEGKLVNDEYMLTLVKNRFNQGIPNGIILDGYPRNVQQADDFDKFKKVDLVLNIILKDSVLVDKLLGRRVCAGCGRNYNICAIHDGEYDMEPLLPTKDPHKCDDCSGELIQRQDDKEDIIRDRLQVWKEFTLPLLNFYKRQHNLITFEPKRGVKDFPQLQKIVEDFLNNDQKQH